MADYNFENLDSKMFEHLTVSLGQVHIARALRPFGTGADGGREATFEGAMDYPSNADPWNGYLVVQCKWKESRGATPKVEADWAIRQLDKEMERYQSAKVRRRVPEYFLFATNVSLSAQVQRGGKDRFVARLQHWVKLLGIRSADVWDREKFSRLLDISQTVAKRFGLLHAGDLLHFAAESVLAHMNGVELTLAVFLQEELRSDQFVRLAQAGHVGDERTPLARTFVDLRASIIESGDGDRLVIQSIQSDSDRPLCPSLITAAPTSGSGPIIAVGDNLRRLRARNPSRFVLVGGPGQGKSTLIQYLAQRHRTALLQRHSSTSLNFETATLIESFHETLQASNTQLPTHPRFPFRIVLEQFSDALAGGKTRSVLDFIAYLIRRKTGRPFERGDAEQLLHNTPWFVAFDGLDEVPAVSNRGEVMTAVRLFLSEAHALDADLLVVATTRPQGYEEEFSPAFFNHLYLTPFTTEEALDYAEKFVQAKYGNDVDRRERIHQRLITAAAEDATARLMISPLQVTIMAALVDVVGNPPRERYPLFARYYDVVYQREQERGIGSSQVLAEHRADIDALHDTAGLLLQIATETAGESQSRLSGHRLRELVRQRLEAIGYEGEDLERIEKDLVNVALTRLVFIVPLEENQYGFEVRSLQEFAAARALMRRGSPEQIKQRLWTISPVPYWRNTVLFAVGLVFAEREDLSDTIAQLCRELNEDDGDPMVFHSRAGSRLSLDILHDGVVDRRPNHRRSFLQTALELLDFIDRESATRLAKAYRPADETRFAMSIRASHSQDSVSNPGIFLLLALLAQDAVVWAQSLLRELWPVNTADARTVFEYVAEILDWNKWQIECAVRVARESPPSWVARVLSPNVPVGWVQDARLITTEDEIEIALEGDRNALVLRYSHLTFTEEELARIAEAQPTHPGWRPYTWGRKFLINPDRDTLTETLVALAALPFSNNGLKGKLPWPLQAILEAANSAELLTAYAKRAENGDFGDARDWAAAEDRWAQNGFTKEDLSTFSDEEWPFVSRIATKGIVWMPLSVRHHASGIVHTVKTLRDAFYETPSTKMRYEIADNIFFCLRVGLKVAISQALISPEDLGRIAPFAKWYVDAGAFLNVFADRSQIPAYADLIAAAGKQICLPGIFNYTQGGSRHGETAPSLLSVAPGFLAGFEMVPSSEGWVRLLASLAVGELSPPKLHIDGEEFSPRGKVAIIILDMFSNGASGRTAADVAKLVADYWSYSSEVTGAHEVQDAIRILATRTPLSDYALSLFDKLLSGRSLPLAISRQVIESLNSSLSYRTSNLGSNAR